MLEHDGHAAVDVVRCQRVLERRLRHPVGLVPRRRALVELRDLARVARACELVLQERGEEMVIPIPVADVVERDEEEVRRVELLQHRLAVASLQNRIAQGRTETREDRRREQELADVRPLAVEHLIREVVEHVATRAR